MRIIEPTLSIGIFEGWIIDLFLVMSLIVLLSTPLALAREAEVPFDGKEQAQPTVAPSTAPETVPSPEQALQAPSDGSSVDFLMEGSPLGPSQTGPQSRTISNPEPAAPETSTPVPAITGHPSKPVTERADEVAMLVSEQCSQNGDATEGSTSCERVYSNGHRTTVLTQNANEGDELKHQTIVEEFDETNTLLYKKTIRHRVDYNYLNDQKAKEKEFFDIIYQPAGKKTTRTLMVYEYSLDTGKTRSLSWTQYQQIGNEPKAGLVYHAMLRYGEDGSPDRGLAEKWNAGEKAEIFMDWSRLSKGYETLDQKTWGQWESWIRNASMQAYLP